MSRKRSQHSALTSQTSHGSVTKSGMFGASTSRRNVMFESKLDKAPDKKKTIQIFDDEGNDVTPRSLLGNEFHAQKGSKMAVHFPDGGTIGTPTELMNQSMFGGQSAFQASYAAGFSKSIMSSVMGSSRASRASLNSVTDEISEPYHNQSFGGLQDVKHTRTDAKEELELEDLKKQISITLEETDTICHLDIPGVSVSNSADNANEVRQRNLRYVEICGNRAGNDMYVQRGMQTFNNAPKTKEVQTNAVGRKEVGCLATNWDMYDTFNRTEEIDEDDTVEEDLLSGIPTQKNDKEDIPMTTSINESMANKSMQSSTESARSYTIASSLSLAPTDDTTDGEKTLTTVSDTSGQLAKVLNSDSLKEHLFVMERTVVQNLYHYRQVAYRGLEDLALIPTITSNEDAGEATVESSPTKVGPNLSRLWSYECAATKDMIVTCMVWNKYNPDLIAVGYEERNLAITGKGMTCVWSIKNPEFPERMYRTTSAVVSIDFSLSHPNFLAVGLHNGTIAVYNIRTATDECVLDSINSPGKHSSPVWQLKWIERDKGTGEEKGEVLISASADGRITQWSIRKGFEYLDLMKVKRTAVIKKMPTGSKKAPSDSGVKKADALISRHAACMCFDFHTTDGNIYLAGTEEGFLHRCSCSYNEQFLETYSGHKSAIYRTLWSPHDPEMFLTCSADWTVRLWHVDQTSPVLTCQASTKAIIDIDWSPVTAVMFAAITEEQIEIWDLSISVLDPLLVNLPVKKVNLTSVKFSLNSEALLVGDCEGYVTIYQIREMNLTVDTQKHNGGWLARVVNATMARGTDVRVKSPDETADS